MKILIVEDEAVVARRIEQFCRHLLGDRLESVRVSATFDDAQATLAESPIDLLMLDLNLDGLDGMALLAASVARSFHTIIVSANIEFALRAFDYGVIDFVAKPFTEERFAQAIRRVTEPDGRASHAARCLAVRKHGRIELIPVADVLYVQGADDYTELVLADGRRELYDKTLDRLLAVLPAGFERIHKSFLVRMNLIVCIHSLEGSRWEAELKNGVRLPVGRTHRHEIRSRLH